MTEIEFKAFMLELVSRKSLIKPYHNIYIEFFSLVSITQIEDFINELNEFLDNNDFGVCDLWGINENLIGGDFYLKLNEKVDFKSLLNKLKEFISSYPFLETITINVKKQEGEYFVTKSIHLGNQDREEPEYYLAPPIPEPNKINDTPKNGGCLGPLSLLIANWLIFLIY